MAIASGGIVFGDDADIVKLEDVKPSDLGQVGEIVITKDDTLILRGKNAVICFDFCKILQFYTKIVYLIIYCLF